MLRSACSSATGSLPIDTESAAIVDVEATPARTYDEVAATAELERTGSIRLNPKRLAADTAMKIGRFLARIVGKG